MRRVLYLAVCLITCLLAVNAWAEAPPTADDAKPEIEAQVETAVEPTVEPLSLAKACDQSFTQFLSGNGCETVLNSCRRACCNQYFACTASCGFDLLCFFACDQADNACVSAC
ncbi:MAG: hypothetical protein AAGN66_16465 [Acidobacteriota bacterium]